MAHLAEVYVHLRPYEVDARGFRQLGLATDEIARSAAERIYRRQVSIDVTLEEGTLLGRVAILGGLLLGAAHFAAEYKDIKIGVTEMCNDARSFGVDVCGGIVKAAKATEAQVFHTEKRLKTPGKLYRLLKRLERLDLIGTSMGDDELRRQLHEARRELHNVLGDMDEDEARAFMKGLKFKHLPEPNNWPKDSEGMAISRVAIKPEEISQAPTGPEETQLFFDAATIPTSIGVKIERPAAKLRYHNYFLSANESQSSAGKPPRTLFRWDE